MIPSAAVQHREKHFNLLLARKLDFLEREHEQNLITLDKLEKFVEFEYNRTQNLRRKNPNLSEINHCGSSTVENSLVNSDIQSDLSISSSTIFNQRKYRRQCFKAQRLPPLIKSNRNKRRKIGSSCSSNIQNENYAVISDPSPSISLPKLTILDRQIQAFMEALPKNQGIAKGFDNFAPSSLYTHRARVTMK